MCIFHSLDLAAPLQRVAAAVLARAHERELLAEGRPWSLAELHADAGDLEFIAAWLSQIGYSQALAMIRPWPTIEVADRRVGTSAAFGLIFLFAAAQVARRHAVEGEVWATVCRHLPWDRSASRVLFVQGQPCSELRDAIEMSAVRFGLRHVFGQEGGMAWMSTVYLQLGFTHRGFLNTLPEWLAGWHRPLAIQRLLGPMRSSSFCTLWSALTEWRHGTRPLSLTRQNISANPWVLPEWTDDLLKTAREKLHLAYNNSNCVDVEAEPSETMWCSEPRLRWDGITEPRFIVEVDLAALPTDSSNYRILLGGSTQAQLVRQPDGRLISLPAGPIHLPNKASVTELSLVDLRGETALTRVLMLWDEAEDVQVFELSSGERTRDPWEDHLAPTHGCLLLLANDLVVQSASPIAWYALPGTFRKLWRIDGTQLPTVQVLLDGQELWRPLLHGQPPSPRWIGGVHLHTRIINGDLLELSLTHGPSIEVCSARVGTTSLQVTRRLPGSTQFAPVNLNATGARSRIRMLAAIRRDSTAERGWVEGRLEFSGACELLSAGWVACNPMTCLTTRDAASHLFRILTQYDGETHRPWILLEGESQQSRATEEAHSVRGLAGLGAPLAIRRGIFHGTEPQIVIGKVVNPGVIRRSRLIVEDGCARLALCCDLDLSPNHRVFAWTSGGVLHEMARESVAICDRSLTLQTIPSGTIAVALAYDGARLGAAWTDDWGSALTGLEGERLAGPAAAMLRWLQLPLLDNASFRYVREFAARNTTRALGAWLAARYLPHDLIHSPATEGWFAAVRAVFRHVRDFPEADLILEDALVDNSRGDLLSESLPQSAWLLGRCDPILLGRILRAWLTMRNAPPHDRHTLAALLKNQFADLPPSAGAPFFQRRHEELLEECVRVLQADDGFVDHLVSTAASIFVDGVPPEDFNKYNLLLAMNRDTFRRLVAIRILDLL